MKQVTLLCSILALIFLTEGCKKKELSLHEAAAAGDIKKVRSLISEGADVNKSRYPYCTPLHSAALHNHIAVAELLIEKGAAVNGRGRSGAWRPLHQAARSCQKYIVELLILKGADVNVRDEGGSTPLHHAFGHTQGDLARRGPYQKEVVELLVNNGTDVKARNEDGMTPLHGAACQGQRYLAELLITKDAEVNAKGPMGQTPLHFAARSWRTVAREGLVALLLEKGAEINARTESGRTALHYSAADGDFYVARLLLTSRADAGLRDNDGKTPRSLARSESHKKVVELFRECGVME